MKRSRAAVALGVVLTALLVPAATGAGAESGGNAAGAVSAEAGKHSTLDSELAVLAASSPGARQVRVEAIARAGRRAELETAIRTAGGTTDARYGPYVEARLPARSLKRLAAHPAARRLRKPVRPYPQTVSEGTATTGAAAWQSAQTTGAGVDIAIIDVGFRGWQAAQAAGELPPDLETMSFCSGGFFDGPDADNHGTAVAEIVRDVAPGAKLHLICVETMASLGQAKDYVVENDIPIVNHSVGWLNTSRGDGTGGPGTPDAIVADARAKGVLWVNAAGNYADVHWNGTFSDPDNDHLHNFVGSDEENHVELDVDGFLCAHLKWDDWPLSDQDFDLLLYRDGDVEPISGSAEVQDGELEPYEEFCFEDLTPLVEENYHLKIESIGTTETPRFDLFVVIGDSLEHTVAAGSVIEPATSPHALAVGAVCFNSGALRDYSSRGPNLGGLTKPDVAGPDGVSTVTYDAASGCVGGFAGTSAATPHVAGAAALIKQANPSFGPGELQEALEARTGPPSPGKNNDMGAGSITLGSAPAVPPSAPVNAGVPTISGLFNQGQTLTAADGAWTGAPTFFVYRWLRCDPSGNNCAPISGANNKTYLATAADLHRVLKVRVTAFNAGGATPAVSAGTPQIEAPFQVPANVLAPSLVGAAQLAQILTAGSGGWTGSAPLTITIEWLRCASGGDACVAIAGAAGSTYQLGLEDIGMTIRVRVTATNPGGSATSTSAASGSVLPPLPGLVALPSVAGTPREGQMLAAAIGSWTFASTFAFQWRRCAAGGVCTDIPGATSATYTPGATDRGLRLQVAVTATNGAGTSSATSPLTASVMASGGTITVPPPQPPPPSGTDVKSRLVVLRFSRTPTIPRAGKRFTLVLRVGTRATSARGATRRISCPAKIGRKTLSTAAKSVRGGTARCAWSIPKQAAGKRLRSAIVVTEGARSVRKSMTARIRR